MRLVVRSGRHPGYTRARSILGRHSNDQGSNDVWRTLVNRNLVPLIPLCLRVLAMKKRTALPSKETPHP